MGWVLGWAEPERSPRPEGRSLHSQRRHGCGTWRGSVVRLHCASRLRTTAPLPLITLFPAAAALLRVGCLRLPGTPGRRARPPAWPLPAGQSSAP